MTHSTNPSNRWPALALLAFALVWSAPALQAEEPVTVSVQVAGRAVPNGRVTATATVEIHDGSTLQSFAWTQIGGVPARINGASQATAAVRLGPKWQYRNRLFEVLAEPPVGPDELPPNVHLPEGEFPGGLQDRFQVAGINPFALEEAGLVTLRLRVRTTSGTYTQVVEVHTGLPWRPSPGIRNVPIGIPVLLHGKTQGSYDWDFTPPAGSTAALTGPRSQDPEFTPDVPGIYTLTVTDQATQAPVTLEIYAGTWRGVIVGQDADGRPLADGLCMACHNGDLVPDMFTPWAQTGHAEIFTNNLNTNARYSASCYGCHTVGYDSRTANGGVDDNPDWHAFLGAGLVGKPGDNWTMMLEEFPAAAQLANVQCESCHGPQASAPRLDTLAHGWRASVTGEPRVSLSSDVCAVCHGEPLRHARFQQWQLSAHANYELAIEEGTSGNCSRCHTGNGFLEWLPVLLDDDPATDPTANVRVTWTEDETHPQTCATCHDPHDIGTTSGSDPNARVRISGHTPPLIGGFQVYGAGKGAICMTCHNSRRGLRNDDNFAETKVADASRAPHGSSQTDVLMGENAYFVNVGVRGRHSLIEDTCVTCHMERTPPPDVLAYNQGGTNHTFFASPDICTSCHEGVTAQGLQTAVDAVLDDLKGLIETRLLEFMADLIVAGSTLNLGNQATLTDVGTIAALDFGETRGRQALTFTFRDGSTVGPLRMTDIDVVQPTPLPVVELYDLADDQLIKAGWNWNLVHNDGSRGAHNPTFVLAVLDAARDALGGRGGPRAEIPLSSLPR